MYFPKAHSFTLPLIAVTQYNDYHTRKTKTGLCFCPRANLIFCSMPPILPNLPYCATMKKPLTFLYVSLHGLMHPPTHSPLSIEAILN